MDTKIEELNLDSKLKLDTLNETSTHASHHLVTDKMSIVHADVPDLEYDEDINSLVADEDGKLGGGQLADHLIDEDYEAELGANANLQSNLIESELEKKDLELKERIDRYGIVNVCGSDLAGRPIIVLSACNLPDQEDILKEKDLFKSHQHFYDVLLEILTNILERYVESEYTLIYFHYGLKSTSQPSLNWLAKIYKMLDRKFKKNLKALYVVHPTMLFRILWQFIRPLISSKFNKKVTYCKSLGELAASIDLSILKIPDEVKMYDLQLKGKRAEEQQELSKSNEPIGPFQQFKVSLEHIANNNKGDPIPLCFKETIIYLRKHLDEEGLFRKSGSYERIKQIQHLYNYGEPVAYDQYEFHVAACVLKAFVRELPESLLNESIFNEMMSLQALDVVDKVEVAKDLVTTKLPNLNYIVLDYLIAFLNEVTQHAASNKMEARNLSYVFGPNFLRKADDPEYGLMDIEKINNFVELLIKYHSEIFTKE